jgi:hypothetical protein
VPPFYRPADEVAVVGFEVERSLHVALDDEFAKAGCQPLHLVLHPVGEPRRVLAGPVALQLARGVP